MKKTLIAAIAMVAATGLGTAYAGLGNGVTDFTGKSYDVFEIAPAADMKAYESSAAGSRRDAGELYNGVTDFTGRSYDRFEIQAARPMEPVIEGSAAGSKRELGVLHNAVTDFSGKSHDNLEIER